jgi:hypothetical protein
MLSLGRTAMVEQRKSRRPDHRSGPQNSNRGERVMLNDWIYNHSVWLSSGVFILTGIIVSGLLVAVMTRLVGAEFRHAHNEWTAFTVTNIGVLYTVLLAFVAVAVWEDLSKASDLVETEAGVLNDLYIEADALSDKRFVKEIQRELRRYIDFVVDGEWPMQQAGRVSRAAAPVLRGVRATLATFEPQTSGDSIMMQEMLHALSQLYDARRSRLEAAAGHLPESVWYVVIMLGLLTIGLMALLSMHSRWMHFLLAASLTTAMVAVIALIVQLDYPFRGTISVSAEPFLRVLPEVGHDVGERLP